jgi:hypothetical protein
LLPKATGADDMARTIPIAHAPVGDDPNRRPVPGMPGVTVDVSALPEDGFSPDTMAVKAYSLSAQMISSVGYQNFVMSGQAGWSYYLYDFYASQSVVNTNTDSPQDATLFALGVRVAVRALDVEGSASFSLGGVAASATLEGTQAQMQLDLVGLPQAAALSYALDLQALNQFNIATTISLGKATGQLIDFLSTPANVGNLSGVPVAVVMNDEAVETAATSFGFALRAIQYGQMRSEAEGGTPNRLPAGVDISDSVIRATYHNVVGSDGPDDPVPQAAKQTARGLTHTGP